MSEYISLEDALKLKEIPNIAKRMRVESTQADVQLWIDHNLLQCYKAAQSDYFDSSYAALFNAASEAEEAFKSDNLNWLCLAMFRLGDAAARMKLLSEHEALKSEYTERRRMIGLDIHNAEKAQLKRIVQAFAEDFWQKDIDKKIRVSEMTDEAYAKTHAVLGKNPIIEYMPEKEAVKDWIRKVAPDYAKKGGRPSKTKK